MDENNMNNNQVPQPEVNVQNNVNQQVNPGTAQTTAAPKKNGKGGLVFAIIAIVVVALIGVGAFLISLRARDPKSVYNAAIDLVKTQYKTGAEEILKEGYKKTIDVDFNVNTGSNGTDDMVEFLNSARINIVYQKDNDFNAQIDVNIADKQGDFANIKANYNDDSKNVFLQLAQLNDKWIDLELDEDDVKEIVDELKYNENKTSLSKQGMEIALEEIRKAILEEDIQETKEQIEYNGKLVDARKNYIVFDEEEYIEFISEIANNLLDNDEFLECIDENGVVYAYLEQLADLSKDYDYGYDYVYDDDDDDFEINDMNDLYGYIDSYYPSYNSINDIGDLTTNTTNKKSEVATLPEEQGMEIEIDLYTTGFFSTKFAGASIIVSSYEDDELESKVQVDYRIESDTKSKFTLSTSDENTRGNTIKGTLYVDNIDENHQNYTIEYNDGASEKYEVNIKVVTSGDIDIAQVAKRNSIKYEDITEADTNAFLKTRFGEIVGSYLGAANEATVNATNNANSTHTNLEAELYNAEFEAYVGDYISANNTKALLEKVKTNNENYEKSLTEDNANKKYYVIKVNYNKQEVGKEELKDLIETKIEATKHYKISIDYEADGYIKTVNIEDAV